MLEQLADYAAGEWVPSRIAFGKQKAESIAERCAAGSRGFQAPDATRHGDRRGATFATDATRRDRGQASLRDARGLWEWTGA